MAKQGGEDIEAFTDKIISKECLLKLINSANKMMSEYGHTCIVTLLEEVKSHRVIPKIIEELSSKNPGLRQKIVEYIQIILSSYDKNIIEKYQPLIEGAIITAISDANKDVRQITRKNFQLYSDFYPAKADKMFSNFDLSIQKALIDEGLVDSRLSPQRKSYTSLNINSAKQNQRPSSSMSGKILSRKPDSNIDPTELHKTTSTTYTFTSDKIESADLPKRNTKKQPESAKFPSKSPWSEKSPAKAKALDFSSFHNTSTNRNINENDKSRNIDISPRANDTKNIQTTDLSNSRANSKGRRSTTPKRNTLLSSKVNTGN